MKKNKNVVTKLMSVILALTLCVAFPSEAAQKNQSGATKKEKKQKIVVIDPGHQNRANLSQEKIGPGSRKTKYKVTGGATGCVTRIRESTLNLAVSKLLKKELEARGYKVYLTRNKQNVNLSNRQRAKIANKYKADIFIRIHANSTNSSSVNGVEMLCMTKNSPYNKKLYKKSYRLSKCVRNKLCKKTKAKKRGITRTTSMSGINWSKVPVTIVEMGYMSNPREDRLMKKKSYRKKIALGIADGIDAYFKR